VVDLSSSLNEEDSIPDTSHNFELTQRLYGELNRALLGPPGDGNVIILSNSNEEEEAHEETTADAKATPSAAVVKPSTLAPGLTLMKTPRQCQIRVMMVWPRVRTQARAAVVETKPARLRLPHQEWLLQQACFKESYVQRYYPSCSFVQRSWDGDTKSLLSLMPFMPSHFYLFLLCPCYNIRLQVDCNRSSLQSKVNEIWIFC
jgi:hypothetical protein